MIRTFGLQPVDVEIDKLGDWRPKGFHLITGKSPRGDYCHAIVGKNGNPVHDPYPYEGENEGENCYLETMDTYTIFVATLETID